MRYRALGRTGIRVSSLCLGAMNFGAWGKIDVDDCDALVRRAVDAGINFIDTADAYSSGESEEILGKILPAVDRDELIVATKFHFPLGTTVNGRGSSRRWIIRACEDSLRRLNTDYIDLYQAHRPDPATDIDETLGALSDLVHAGKIRSFGSSTFPPSMIVQARWMAERRGRERFSCEQPPYSILVRGIETELLPICMEYGMGAVCWSPLAGGWLSGKYGPGQENASHRATWAAHNFDMTRESNQRKLEAVGKLATVAADAGMALPTLAVGFTLQHPGISSAIIGPRTLDHLESILPAADVDIADDVLDAVDAIVAPGSNFAVADGGWLPSSLTNDAARRGGQPAP